MKQYPKWLYHKTEKAYIVPDHQAHIDAGPEWFETPGEAEAGQALNPVSDAAPAAPPVAPPSDPAVTSPVVPVAPVDPPAAPPVTDPVTEAAVVEAEKTELYATSITKIVEKLKNASKATLERVANYEAGNPAGPRAGLVKAIAAAVKKLEQQ